MKFDIFLTCIAIAAGFLLAYLIFLIGDGLTGSVLTFAIAGGICSASSLVGMLALKFDDSRVKANFRVLCALFLVVFLILSVIFAVFDWNAKVYLVISGIILLIYFLSVYKMNQVELM